MTETTTVTTATTAPAAPDTPPAPQLDLDAYLTRVGWSGERRPSAATLRALTLAHVTSIPFENLDPLLGSAPSLALPDLEAKLVHGRRGGYCYEQNTLLTAALRAFGFAVTGLTARVRVGARGALRPRTHMLLLVDVPGEERPYVADVGFGSVGGLLEAVPLVADSEFHDGPRRHRFVREPHPGLEDLWVLQAFLGGADGVWEDQYAFTREPYEHPDYEVINWHIATNPRSPFRHTLVAQRSSADRHLALFGRTLTETYHDGTRKQRELADEAEVLAVLRAEFGIEPPEGAQLER
ncbi:MULTISPECIES: arylamine N-acetyltransferase [unclassified Streptomyces]|uniref:arylamine N-acetyltransferase family protein n=1 Tax=unclassified Streptomyces TaxID=2593676 RepID=UPI00336A0B90